jgi:hypothetical protein
MINAAWLSGTWGPAENNPRNDPSSSCDTDAIVTFASDGTYQDGGSYGRYRTDGKTITYFDRVMIDEGDGSEDRSQFSRPLVTSATRVDQNSIREDGALLRRCNG